MRYFAIIVLALVGCTQTNSTESQTADETSAADSVQAAPGKAKSKEQVAEISVLAKIPLSNEYLTEFSFSSHADEAIFSDDGTFVLANLADESLKAGGWLLSHDSLLITVEGNKARYTFETIGPDDCQLVAGDEFSATLFRKGPGDFSADGYVHLFRNTLSSPFPKEAMYGQWSDLWGGTGFDADGKFGHSEPDCWTKGSWKFDGEDLVMRVTESKCEVSPPQQFKILKLSRKQLVLKKLDGSVEAWLRQN